MFVVWVVDKGDVEVIVFLVEDGSWEGVFIFVGFD